MNIAQSVIIRLLHKFCHKNNIYILKIHIQDNQRIVIINISVIVLDESSSM